MTDRPHLEPGAETGAQTVQRHDAVVVTGGRRFWLVAVLFAAMGSATLPALALGIVATFIIDDLGITRASLGWVVTANTALAALISPFAGGWADRLGGRRALVVVFVASAGAFAVFGIAPGLAVLFIASATAAIAQAGGNPATNKLIEDHLPPGSRGVTTGVKQSGVQAGVTTAGLTLPALAIAVGWRGAMLAAAIVPIVGAIATGLVIPPSRRDGSDHRAEHRVPLPSWVRWLAAYGLVMGFAGSVTFYVPLFAEEAVGLDPRIGGAAIALTGAVAFAARILWARHAERSGRYIRSLATMALLGSGAAAVLSAATSVPWLLWLGVALVGLSTSAWNSVGMLAVIDGAGVATGRASGVVLFGFLIGLGLGPPVLGATIDATGSYATMWVISITACLVAAGIVWLWRRTTGPA